MLAPELGADRRRGRLGSCSLEGLREGFAWLGSQHSVLDLKIHLELMSPRPAAQRDVVARIQPAVEFGEVPHLNQVVDDLCGRRDRGWDRDARAEEGYDLSSVEPGSTKFLEVALLARS